MSSAFTQYLSISELNQRVSTLLERQIPLLWVQGEISNLTRAASGHWYFSLKDAGAQVRAVMFRHKNTLLNWQPREGDAVQAQVLAGLFAARGDFQLTVETMRPAGQGALYERFLKLKDELARKGWFDANAKKDLPRFIRHIGIVTSPQAAALRDVANTLARRAPHVELQLYPSLVQGNAAPAQIAAAIRTANQNKQLDALLIVRGGGSLEDLWAFNETIVAQALFESRLPTISGVGHETDTTIADFVADHRAATPTAAAELISSPSRADHLTHIDNRFNQLKRSLNQQLAQQAQKLDRLSLQLLTPSQRVNQQRQILNNHQTRLQHAINISRQQHQHHLERSSQRLANNSPHLALTASSQQLNRLSERLKRGITLNLQQLNNQLNHRHASLNQLNPDNILARGFAYVLSQNGEIVRNANHLQTGDGITVQFHQGRAVATVNHVDGGNEEAKA